MITESGSTTVITQSQSPYDYDYDYDYETSTSGGRRLKSIITRCSSSDTRGRLKSIITRCSKRPSPDPHPYPCPSPKHKKSRRSVSKPVPSDIGYNVDLSDLLFTRDRDYLVRNNGQKVSARRLRGKTVVLYIVTNLDGYYYMNPGESLDMVQAYHELLPLGDDVEFVLVPVYHPHKDTDFNRLARFNNFFSTIPFPAVPFSDTKPCGDRVVKTFSVDQFGLTYPYWVILDPKGTVVATRGSENLFLFKLFGGAELYPLSRQSIDTAYDNYGGVESLDGNWDQLLVSPNRDFLLSSNGCRVPVSSLEGKVIGLYFCDNVPCPPRMDVIKEAYREAKLRGYDFEIVQINFHFKFFYAREDYFDAAKFSKQQHYENINWLTLPFKDPCCRILQRIFKCEFEDYPTCWRGDCLVIVDPRQADEVNFEFSGAEVIQEYGIEAYPFTRASIFETEYTRLKKEVRLQFLFPHGLCQFTTRRDGFDKVNYSPLIGKRVIVLFGKPSKLKNDTFISMLKSKSLEQTQEDKFEVVFVSTEDSESSSFTEYIQDMPWLVHPYSHEFGTCWYSKIFKHDSRIGAAAFGIDGELIAKDYLTYWGSYTLEEMVHRYPFFKMEHRFPFFTQDMRQSIQEEWGSIIDFDECGL